jgi:GST-like protein
VIDLYTGNTSNGQRAAIVLEECGLPYRVHKFHLFTGDHRNIAEFGAVAPAGAIPVIVDPEGPDGKPVTLSQSCAIILYVAQKSGKFMPADARKRIAAFEWLMQAASDVSSASAGVFFNNVLLPEKSEPNGKWYQDKALKLFGDCDRRLGDREYLADEISVADFALYPVYAVRKKIIDEAGTLRNLTQWGERMAARPALQRAMKAAE